MPRPDKDLWNELDLGYVRRRPFFRTSKRWLSIACFLGAAAWLVWAAEQSDEGLYVSGTMSPGHSMFADNCNKCHTPFEGAMELVSSNADMEMNKRCLDCHGHTIGFSLESQAALHQSVKDNTYKNEGVWACSSCHIEHEGLHRLVQIGDDHCLQCHADASKCQVTVGPFDAVDKPYHPQFRVHLDADSPDPTRIKFPHDKHMSRDIDLNRDGRKNEDDFLYCHDCHRAGPSTDPWRYGDAGLHEESYLTAVTSELDEQGDFMTPTRYTLHCSGCHGLPTVRVDDTVLGQVPHSSPEAIRAYLWGVLVQHYRDTPAATRTAATPRRRLYVAGSEAEHDVEPAEPVSEQEILATASERVAKIEGWLYTQSSECVQCHYIQTPEGGGIPVIEPPNITKRWFTSASFTHQTHNVWHCSECHPDIQTFDSAALHPDIPKIATCRNCHGPAVSGNSASPGGADFRCIVCHTYHRPHENIDPRGVGLVELFTDPATAPEQ